MSGSAPDVFVNHVSRYPEFLANGVMADLTDRIAADGYDMTGFLPGLAETWSREGRQWGMPKDWDTIGVFYNADALAEAGLTPADLQDLTWNPQDGGSWEQTIARLTVDGEGRRGTDPDFDKDDVRTFGYVSSPLSAFGQTEWSYLAVSNGFSFIDQPWGSRYLFDDPKVAEALNWLQDLSLEKGLMPAQQMAGRLGAVALLTAGRGVMATEGSWMIGSFLDNAGFKVGFAPLPAGPEGRKSMFNGLADSIWSGSPHQDEAWEWVKFLGSSECQSIVGRGGVVFPARPEAVDLAIAAFAERGVDVTAFTDVATAETTFPFPMTGRVSEVDAILRTVLDRIMLGQGEPAELLPAANDQINALLD